MNILFDYITFQIVGGVGGAASFSKRIIDEILSTMSPGTSLYALYDSTLPCHCKFDFQKHAADHGITLLDIAKKHIHKYIKEQNIHVFLIAIGQHFAQYDLTDIHCKTIMFIHDIFDIERNDNWIDTMLYDKYTDSYWTQGKRYLNLFTGRWNKQANNCYSKIIPLYAAESTIAYTVSEYTKSALQFYFPSIKKEIRVCYSPIKSVTINKNIDSPELLQLIESKHPYLIQIATNRRYKNPKMMMKVFPRLTKAFPDLHLLTLKYGRTIHPSHIDIDYLSDSDLEHAYQHATALIFASFFEGFGYPPIEAMRYGTPTIAANVTSIPEIIGDAGEYFSPFYAADLYKAIFRVLTHRDQYQLKMKERFSLITNKQVSDLNKLVNEIYTI